MLQKRRALQLGGCLWLGVVGWRTVHPAASRLAACCNVWWLLQFLSVCAAGLPSLRREQGSRHMAGTSLHVSNRLYGQGAAGTVYSICSSGSGHQSEAPMTSGYLFTASLVMEEEPEVSVARFYLQPIPCYLSPAPISCLPAPSHLPQIPDSVHCSPPPLLYLHSEPHPQSSYSSSSPYLHPRT